jgi:spermidine synthase
MKFLGTNFRAQSLILPIFFASGASGLIYQVVWTRKLALLFGTTAYAVSTVLFIFFLGLGVGSLIGGRVADRVRRPLLLYALCELVIAVWAIAFIYTIGATDSAAARVLGGVTDSRLLAVLARTALATVYLFVPVCLMGATLPLIAKFATRDYAMRGRAIGFLYGINTLGAVTGCVAAGFWILPTFGYTLATVFGASLNGVAAIASAVLSRYLEGVESVDKLAVPPAKSEDALSLDAQKSHGLSRTLFFCFALSGFCALALEVLWTRLLTLVFIGTTFAYTTMLTAMLTGIALGSALAALYTDRIRHHALWYGLVQGAIGVSCVAMLGVFAKLPEWMSLMRFDSGGDWAGLTHAWFVLSFSVLLVPTLLFGAGFPLIVRALINSAPELGRRTGSLYSVNTFGGVAGSLACGFAIIPLLGTQRGIVLLSALMLASGMYVILRAPDIRRSRKWAGAGFLGAAFIAGLFTAPDDIGMAMNRSYIGYRDQILFFHEGTEGTVVVSGASAEHLTDRTLWINAVQATMSIQKGVRMNRFQGVLPVLFNREPKTALFMCFGSGVTVGTLAQSPFERIDAVELSADVLKAAPQFASDNLDVVNNPRVSIHVDDGRNFLTITKNTYDVITFEPMPLAVAGVSTFYTTEYYRLCLEHLAPGGVVSQWIPLHSLNPVLVRDLTATFAEVFPYHCAWLINADLFLTGSNAPLVVDYDTAVERLSRPELKKILANASFPNPVDVLGCFYMSQQNVEAYAKGGRIMSDDLPWAEFEAPKLMFERNVAPALRELWPFYEGPEVLVKTRTQEQRELLEKRGKSNRAMLEGKRMVFEGPAAAAEDKFIEALRIDDTNADAAHQLSEVVPMKAEFYMRGQEFRAAASLLDRAISVSPGDAGLTELKKKLDELKAEEMSEDKGKE